MTSIPGGVGSNLVGGLTSWVTGLGGGQDVYDTAARMVQGADPKISQDDPSLAQPGAADAGQHAGAVPEADGSAASAGRGNASGERGVRRTVASRRR